MKEPDWYKIEDDNKWINSTEWTADKEGFVLITTKGNADFEIKKNNESIVKSNKKDKLDDLFTQLIEITKKDKISIDNKKLESYVCQYVPYKSDSEIILNIS